MSIRSSNLYANHILFCLPHCPTSLKASFCLCSYQFNTSPLLYSTGPCWSPVSLIMSTNYSVQKCASNSNLISGRTISNSGIPMANMSNRMKTLSDNTGALLGPRPNTCFACDRKRLSSGTLVIQMQTLTLTHGWRLVTAD